MLHPKLDLNDLISHRRPWRDALADCVKRCEDSGDEDNASYWRHELEVFDRTFSIFTSEPAAVEIPAGLRAMLPDFAAENAYRLLIKEGFRVRYGDHAWLAPDDEPLTHEQILAVGELQQHGFGSVTRA